MGFKDEVFEFNERIKNLDSTAAPEIIYDSDALAALIVLNFIKYEKVPDAFLAVAALNMLNRYVKQPKSRIGYKFRIHIINVLKGIEDIGQKKSIYISYVPNRNNLWIFRLKSAPFSEIQCR